MSIFSSISRMILALLVLVVAAPALLAQRPPQTADERARRAELEAEIQEIAIVERKIMVPMRDGVRLATDVYRPRNTTGKVPIVWSRTPYNFNFWDVRNRVPADMSRALTALKHFSHSPRATSLLPATGSGSRCRAATSRASTET